MKISGAVLLCCALLVNGQGTLPGSGSDSDETTTTAKSTTSTSTSTSTTTSTTTTTEPPKTTTTEPSTTTPPATTTAGPTPAPTPVPDYPRNIGRWSVEAQDNQTSCIELKSAMQLVIVNLNKTETINVPPSATSSGTCEGTQSITLKWSATGDKVNSLSLSFGENSTKGTAENSITVGKYGLQTVRAVLYLNSENATTIDIGDIDKFQTPLNHSYSCLAEEVIKSKDGNFTLKVREVQLEAYRHVTSGHHEFSAAVQCPADDATDVVPIAVGGALAGLVIIVLIAYLVGRKRSRARGYQSV